MTDHPAPPLGEKTDKRGPELAPSRPVTTFDPEIEASPFRRARLDRAEITKAMGRLRDMVEAFPPSPHQTNTAIAAGQVNELIHDLLDDYHEARRQFTSLANSFEDLNRKLDQQTLMTTRALASAAGAQVREEDRAGERREARPSFAHLAEHFTERRTIGPVESTPPTWPVPIGMCASFCETCFRTVIEVREAEPEAELATRLRRKLEGRSQLAYPVDRADIERLLCILEERATLEGGADG